MATKENKTEEKEKYEVGEVAVQTEPVIVDTTTNDTYSIYQFLAKLGNDVEKLKKLLD